MKKNRRLNLLVLLISCLAIPQLYGYRNSTSETPVEIFCESSSSPSECVELTTINTHTRVTDVAEQEVSAVSEVSVLIDGEEAPLDCILEITVLASYWSGPEMWGSDFVVNSEDFDEILVSLDPLGPFTSSFIAPCGINDSDPVTVYIQATKGTDLYECSSSLTVNDYIPPIGIANSTIYLNLVNGSATLTSEMVDDGSYDNCTEVLLSLDKTNFTTEDIGENLVVMSVTDLNGNESNVFTNVIVDEGTGCNLVFVLFPNDIEIYDENDNGDNLSIDKLQSEYGYTFEEVHPYTINDCEDIGYSYEDSVIPFGSGIKVLRTWTVVDLISNEVINHIQILKLYTDLENLVIVRTGTNRGIPGVVINDSLVTNLQGGVYVENDPVNSIQYEDSKFNGLNVLDLVLIRKAILGAITFDNYSSLAGDVNQNEVVSTLDLVLLERYLLGKENNETDFAWRFYDQTIAHPSMKGSYLGIKPGDVDDSVLLEGDDLPVPVGNFEVDDMLISEGEMYSVPIYLDNQYDVLGAELRVKIDSELISISNVTTNTSDVFFSYNVTEDGILTVFSYDSYTVEKIGGDSSAPVFNIEFEAKGNSSISEALDMESHLSYLGSSSSDLIVLGGKILNEGIYQSSFICDTLPRTAEFGDCDSGHTMADDVEWPGDLDIVDYRISPAELIEFSSIDELDSEPSFYHSPDDYVSSYQDLVLELTNTTLTIGREWTVDHKLYGFTWTYDQTIVVDFSEFDNLVTVNTGSNRAMPGVLINDQYSTNMQGLVYVEELGDVIATYDDDFLNGVNIVDFILIQRHIIGEGELTGYGLIAADINDDNKISSSDLTYLRKVMLDIVDPSFPAWRFYDKEIEGPITIKPKAALTGVKAGDVDDSAVLIGDEVFNPEDNFNFADLLLNKGETYSIPVYLENKYSIHGLDFRIKVDTNLLEILEVTSDQLPSDISFHVNNNNEFRFASSNPVVPFDIGEDLNEPVFFIEAVAKENSLLSLALDSEEMLSFMASSSFELIVLGSEVEGVIGTGTNSEELSNLKVYPNPAYDYLNIDMKNVNVQGAMEVSVFGLDGQKLLTRSNVSRLDVTGLSSGMYYYQINVDSYSTTGKFIVIDR